MFLNEMEHRFGQTRPTRGAYCIIRRRPGLSTRVVSDVDPLRPNARVFTFTSRSPMESSMRTDGSALRLFILASALVGDATGLLAQPIQSSALTGRVTDRTGGALPGARVTAFGSHLTSRPAL